MPATFVRFHAQTRTMTQHSYIAAGVGGQDNSIIVDLSKNKGVEIDESSGTAVIQYGNRLGDVALALNDKGQRY